MTIDLLRTICTSLTAVTEDIKWDNDLVFSVGGKMFCVASLEPPFKCSFKVRDDEFDELSITDGFLPAPYLARAKWILVTKSTTLNRKEWERRIRISYDLVVTKLSIKLKKEIGVI